MSTREQLSEAKRRLLEKFLRGEVARENWEAPIEPRRPGTPIPLAPSQQLVWLHAQMAPGTPLYNEPITLHYRGALDRHALERSFHEILRRHEIWRTTFAAVDGQVVQAVHDNLRLPLPLTDLTNLPEDRREEEALWVATTEARRPFDLGVGPLLRARLVKFADDYHRIYLTLHHIIFDGVAIYRGLLPELSAIYGAFSRGLPSPLPEPRYQYADFALWEKRLVDNHSTSRQMEYWRQQLSGDLPSLQLPTDHPRRAVPSHRGGMETFTLSRETTDAVYQTSRNEGVTPYMLLLAVFKTLFHRYSGQQDLLVGAQVDGRRRIEFEALLGFCLNTVVIRTEARGDITFRQYLMSVKDAVLDALANKDVPLDELIRKLQPKRDFGRSPLFQAVFSMEPPPPQTVGGWDLTQMDTFNGHSKIDLYLELDERPEGFIARFVYSAELFDASTIRRMIGHWTALLGSVLRDPGALLSELPLLTSEEARLVSTEWNQTAVPVPHTTIHESFEARAARNPRAVAVQCDSVRLTYGELNREANRLARRLREAGAGPETLVALCVERSCDMVVALLGILKSGAAYLPLDPAFPAERFNFILQDARAPILVTERWRARELPDTGAVLVFTDEGSGTSSNLAAAARTDSLAYVLYTSGSTGSPKGVEIPHSAAVNFLESMRREPGFTASDTLLAITTLSFDIAFLEIFLPLTTGGRVVIASQEDARDPMRLREAVQEASPTVMQATPATWRALVDAGWTGASKLKILCGGEAMPQDLAQQLLPRCAELWNMYGPTETTVWSTLHRVGSESGPVSIGHPIANTQVYVLDASRNLVPPGVAGELYIGGSGVARGYLRRDELTRERFVEVPSLDTPEVNPGRLYRTGDLARWLPDGTLECLGRADNQIKIRGFRIEPEEIEAAILKHPEVRGAAVKAWTGASGHQSLVGYLVSPQRPDLRAFLQQKLPQYMIPSRLVWLDSLPLTPNGKIDRGRLPQPDEKGGRAEFASPSSAIERRLTALWESVLDQTGIGVRDNFFELGGHSLLVAKLLRRVEAAFGERLSLSAIFQAPTIEQFAGLLQDCGAVANLPCAINFQPAGSRSPLLWLYAGPIFRGLAAHLGSDRPFLGISATAEEVAALPESFCLEDLAACLVRSIREVQPQGPYYLGGWCDEGILAYEVASQLRRQGGEVGLLILLDSINPARYRRTSRIVMWASRARFQLRRMAALRGRKDILEYARERVRAIRDRNSKQQCSVSGTFLTQFNHATLHYDPKPYDGRLAAFRPALAPEYRDPRAHWGDRATGEFRIVETPGTHVTMLQEPGVAELAARIRRSLDDAEAACYRAPIETLVQRRTAG